MIARESVYVDGPTPTKPREPTKPRIDAEAVRGRIEDTQHSLLEHLHSEVAALKKSLRREGISADDPLDDFIESAEASWTEAVESIEETLE